MRIGQAVLHKPTGYVGVILETAKPFTGLMLYRVRLENGWQILTGRRKLEAMDGQPHRWLRPPAPGPPAPPRPPRHRPVD
jgi:hypothetical protein